MQVSHRHFVIAALHELSEMKIATIVASLVLTACWPAPSASAQQVLAAGQLDLAGYQATCGSARTVVLRMADIAATQGGTIYLSSVLMERPRAEQLFWYTHECAHLIFGAGEMRADCWAVQQGRLHGWLSPDDFDVLAASMRRHPGDRAHPPGPQRVAAMAACYDR